VALIARESNITIDIRNLNISPSVVHFGHGKLNLEVVYTPQVFDRVGIAVFSKGFDESASAFFIDYVIEKVFGDEEFFMHVDGGSIVL